MSLPPTSFQDTLGPYELVRVLGEGGMGTVYLAVDPALQRQVAIKVLRTQNGQATKRFLREAQSAARLNHPHVVTIYSIEPAGPRPYIVMEYVPGGSLAQRLRANGPWHWREAMRAVRDTLRALAAAHQAGIVHRDVKPANLMVARDAAGQEVIKLADFGLARIAQAADAELTFPGAFVGSPSYSSPEQIAGAAHLDGRADLYSLAATSYALLTGQPPFLADDPADVMERHMRDSFPDVRLLAPTVPEEVQFLIAKASQKNPGKRYATAHAMAEEVDRLLQLPAEVTPAALPKTQFSPPAGAALPGVRGSDSYAPAMSRATESVAELESRLVQARAQSDSSTQLSTLRSLYGLYAQLDRRQDALRAFREALVVHVKMHAPANN
jgi:eukaryotic-like serine/threonine-protein kinase